MPNYSGMSKHVLFDAEAITAGNTADSGIIRMRHGLGSTLSWLITQAGTVSVTFSYRISYSQSDIPDSASDITDWSDFIDITTSAAGNFGNDSGQWDAKIISLVDGGLVQFRATETGSAQTATVTCYLIISGLS